MLHALFLLGIYFSIWYALRFLFCFIFIWWQQEDGQFIQSSSPTPQVAETNKSSFQSGEKKHRKKYIQVWVSGGSFWTLTSSKYSCVENQTSDSQTDGRTHGQTDKWNTILYNRINHNLVQEFFLFIYRYFYWINSNLDLITFFDSVKKLFLPYTNLRSNWLEIVTKCCKIIY